MDETASHSMDWKVKQDIAKTVMSAGGILFGGFVRDSILHDYWAKKYYLLAEEEGFLEEETKEKYRQKEIFPETIDRMVVPKDIDCYLPSSATVASFENLLSAKKYSYERVFVREDAKEYLPRLTVPDNTLLHIRYKVCCVNSHAKYKVKQLIANALPATFYPYIKESVSSFIHNLQDMSTHIPYVYIDTLVQKKCEEPLYPPFGNIDFECNALLMSEKGIYLSPELHTDYGELRQTTSMFKLNEIVLDIIHKKAIMVRSIHPIDMYRVSKMRLKGWNIVAPTKYILPIEASPDLSLKEKEICIVCHDSIQLQPHYKLRCCAAKYHKECLLNCIHKGPAAMSITTKCIMCKRYVPYILEEGNMLQVL